MTELQKEEHTPETEEYGISSFVYERRLPFHPERFTQWMENWPVEVVRAKGTVWLASRNQMGQSISQAGPSIRFGPAGYWVDALPEEEKRLTLQEEPELLNDWDEIYGDRINKIVFIGIDMDQRAMLQSLDQCLLTSEEIHSDWTTLIDSLPNVAAEI
jgi:G3E family GTPase